MEKSKVAPIVGYDVNLIEVRDVDLWTRLCAVDFQLDMIDICMLHCSLLGLTLFVMLLVLNRMQYLCME